MAGNLGGARPGAGRPKGTKLKRTQELITKAVADGISPMDVLLKDMRFFYELAQTQLLKAQELPSGKQAKAFRAATALKEIARDCAIAAAPYIHPKLSSIQANVNVQEHEARLADFRDEE